MAKKKNTTIDPVNYVLPSDNQELENFAEKFKVEMMEQVVNSIEYAIKHRLNVVEVFQFKNSDFVITLAEKDYLTNLNNIFNYYLQNEVYEYCPRVAKLQQTIQSTPNEKTKR